MPDIATPTSLVALGRAGTGAATVLEGGNRPLDMLLRQDALNERIRARAQAAAQREQEAGLRDFSTAAKLNTKGFLPFQQRLDAVAQEKYTRMEQTARDRNLDRATKLSTYRKEAADMEGLTNLTNEIEQKTKGVLAMGQDKRFKKGAVEKAAYETFYNPDTKEALDPREYDPAQLDTLADKTDLYDVNEVVSQFVKETFAADSVQRATAARPGGTGMSRQATSNLFELNEDGTVKIDPVTRKEVMKVTDETLRTANNDPFVKNLLDATMRQREEGMQAIEAKMRNLEPLTDQERQFAATEGQKTGIDDLKELLVSHAYLRQSERETFRAKPQPRSSAGRAPKYSITGTGGSEYVAPTETASGRGSEGGMYSPYKQNPRTRVTSSGKVEPVSFAAAKHTTYAVQVPGQKARFVTNNPVSGPLNYNGMLMALVNPNTGNMLVPGPDVPKNEAGFLQWAKEQQSKPGFNKFSKIDWVMEATPDKKGSFLGTTSDDILANLEETQQKNAGIAGVKEGTSSVSNKPIDQMSDAETLAMIQSFQQGKFKFRSRVEMAALANKLSKQEPATYYIPYAKEKAAIDSYTNGVYKPSKQEQDQINAYNQQLRSAQGAAPAARKPAATGSGPLADDVAAFKKRKAGPSAAAQTLNTFGAPPAAKPAPANKYGFKFSGK